MPAIGDVVGDRYRLEKQLGVGSMGSVWHATHITLGNDVAIKLIKQAAAKNPRSLARFQREAVLAARIDSPHAVEVIDHGHHDGLPFIVMDHLVGEDLRARLQRVGRLSVDDTIVIVKHCCRALAAAHRVALVHRDIKPENLFLTPSEDAGQERVIVLDFGVAKASDTIADKNFDPTVSGTIIGTPYYLSPEQALGLSTLGPPADQWSLAVVAFECLTGERPFQGISIAPLLTAITNGPIPSPSSVAPDLPRGLDAWFERALSRDPAGRFADAMEMSRTFVAATTTTAPATAAPAPVAAAARTLTVEEHARAMDPRVGIDTSQTLALPQGYDTLALPSAVGSLADAHTIPLPGNAPAFVMPPAKPAPAAPPPAVTRVWPVLIVVAVLVAIGVALALW